MCLRSVFLVYVLYCFSCCTVIVPGIQKWPPFWFSLLLYQFHPFQAMLREFEDQENLLSEMDEQVDAYRECGKLEAAARLEDQLHLIHQRFQELLMKFELFQQQPAAVDYEPRLARVHRSEKHPGQIW